MIIYNHHYPNNIERLNRIYGQQFKKIIHIIPFYEGNCSNVISVYENSFQFQGYISQSFASLSELNSDHFLFIADDMILNPKIDEHSYSDVFRVDSDLSFFPDFIQLGSLDTYWPRLSEALNWEVNTQGVEMSTQMPSYQEATNIFEEFGWFPQFLNSRAVFRRRIPLLPLLCKSSLSLKLLIRTTQNIIRSNIRIIIDNIQLRQTIRTRGHFFAGGRKIRLQYPLVGGYSDLVLVSKSALPLFAKYCGLFAASRLHVELAIPTALVFATRKIVTEKDISRSGRAYWGEEVEELDIYKCNLDTLLRNFPDDKLFIHPVKLSQWN